MPTLIIQNLAEKHIEITHIDKSVLFHIQVAALDWMHACGGKGRCTTCRIRVIKGMSNTSDLSAAEQKFRQLGRLSPNERLTCQVRITGNITAEVPEACKLPHITYKTADRK